jgi:hypothetical protein
MQNPMASLKKNCIQVGGDAKPLRCREKERYRTTKKIDGIEQQI